MKQTIALSHCVSCIPHPQDVNRGGEGGLARRHNSSKLSDSKGGITQACFSFSIVSYDSMFDITLQDLIAHDSHA